MAIPIVESESVASLVINSTQILVGIPGGVVADDIVLIFCALDGDAANPTSTGFSTLTSSSEGTVELYILWKRATGSESGTYTVNWTGSEQGRFQTIRISGCITTGDPWDVIGAEVTNSSSTTNVPTRITSTVIDTLALAFVAVDRDRVDGSDQPNGTGWAKVGASGSSGTTQGAGSITGENDMPSIAQVEALTFGSWSSEGNCSRIFNLKPAGEGLTAVGRTFNIRHDIAELVNRIFNIRHDILEFVNRSFNIRHDILNLVERTFNIRHNISQFVGRIFNLRHDLAGAIGRTFNIRHDILILVGRIFNIRHDILILVGRTWNLRHDIAEFVGRTFNLRHDLAGSIGRVFDVRHDISQFVNNTFNIRYDILILIGRTFNLRHDIAELVGRIFNLRHDLAEVVGRIFNIRHDIAQFVNRIFNIRYDIFILVGRIFNLRHDIIILTQVGRTFNLRHDILQLVNRTFNIRHNISTTLILLGIIKVTFLKRQVNNKLKRVTVKVNI